MEGILMALVGVIGTMVGGGIWFLKFLTRKAFGKEGTSDHGFTGAFLAKFDALSADLRENTAALKEMQSAQDVTNETLTQLLECSRAHRD